MTADVFMVVADPTRRRILHELVDREQSVGELVGTLGLSQPMVSKHLKVLRDNGFVASRTAAQQRIYRLDHLPFIELETWLGPFRQKWHRHMDALERHLDSAGPEFAGGDDGMDGEGNVSNVDDADGLNLNGQE